ncbi:MAG: formate transporter [Acidobacteria bacterium RIFCSPLOWO2_02_FULL_68_18]|nr:MAG: formate transporter [Acidobacteria bacterium RIFCSPLOWO2_02_FULL_68_18]OFW49830.1 MAG: formate transporter [Acidobacteria bacterium RIFCSPLOWO2_12_FULL_68_19]
MDYVKPAELVEEAIQLGEKKAGLPVRDLLVRSFLCGVLLAYATSLAWLVVTQGLPAIAGALVFPVGFVMLVLLGFEIATGNFCLLPLSAAAGRVHAAGLLRNWGWVYLGNLVGALFYALLFAIVITKFGTIDGGLLAEQAQTVAQNKTLAYMKIGAAGWIVAVVSGVLCNWMVTIGTMLSMVSRSTIGKIVAMWLPILTFFALGYEHAIVNMFAIPVGMMLGAPVSVPVWLFWNQIPVTIGNIIGGALLTALPLYATFKPAQAAAVTSSAVAGRPARVVDAVGISDVARGSAT